MKNDNNMAKDKSKVKQEIDEKENQKVQNNNYWKTTTALKSTIQHGC